MAKYVTSSTTWNEVCVVGFFCCLQAIFNKQETEHYELLLWLKSMAGTFKRKLLLCIIQQTHTKKPSTKKTRDRNQNVKSSYHWVVNL